MGYPAYILPITLFIPYFLSFPSYLQNPTYGDIQSNITICLIFRMQVRDVRHVTLYD